MTTDYSITTNGLPEYEVFAVRYATRDALRKNHFIGGDPHDGPMPMDYFVWVVRSPSHTFVVDTGFGAEVAAKRGRTLLRTPAQGLALIGVDVNQVKDVIITHLHYDHVGTFDSFPIAQFHLQDDEMAYATGRHMRHKQFNHGYEVDEVVGMVRMVYKDRVRFYNGEAELAPGLTIHRIGGHTYWLRIPVITTSTSKKSARSPRCSTLLKPSTAMASWSNWRHPPGISFLGMIPW
jgi:glyoxylase-like metal-dependent hydrolase (beta-lactamase superfamily II)